jgi:hypothetical protein
MGVPFSLVDGPQAKRVCRQHTRPAVAKKLDLRSGVPIFKMLSLRQPGAFYQPRFLKLKKEKAGILRTILANSVTKTVS